MGKSVAIAAFVILLISLIIPIVGNYISLLAVLMLCVSAYQGERTWTVTTDIIAWVKMFALSPTWQIMMFGGGQSRTMRELGTVFLLATIAILAAPITILVWKAQSQNKPSDGGPFPDA